MSCQFRQDCSGHPRRWGGCLWRWSFDCLRTARLSDDKLGLHALTLSRVVVLVSNSVEKNLDCARAEVTDRYPNRRQGWIHVACERNIVEASNRDIFGNLHTRFTERAQRADRHRVVGSKHCRRAWIQFQNPERGRISTRLSESTLELERSLRVESRVFQREAITTQSLRRIVVSWSALDDRDALVAETDQVLHHRPRTTTVVDDHRVDRVTARDRTQEHHRQRRRNVEQRLGVQVGRHCYDSLHAAAHRAHRRLDAVLRRVRAADDEMKSVALGRVVHSSDHFREEFSIEIRQEDSERVRLARDETARATMGDVPEASGNFPDAVLRLGADWSASVENAGDGGNGDVCFTGYVLDRDHALRRM